MVAGFSLSVLSWGCGWYVEDLTEDNRANFWFWGDVWEALHTYREFPSGGMPPVAD